MTRCANSAFGASQHVDRTVPYLLYGETKADATKRAIASLNTE